MPKKKLVHQFTPAQSKGALKEVLLPAGVILGLILFGAVSGYFLANRGSVSLPGSKMIQGNGKMVASRQEMGLKDEEAFPDKSQGKIEVNDSKTILEGSHKLLRAGGESKSAYLTSSVVDLDQFVNDCVEVWGETFSAQSAGWLMDVGYIKRLDECPEGV